MVSRNAAFLPGCVTQAKANIFKRVQSSEESLAAPHQTACQASSHESTAYHLEVKTCTFPPLTLPLYSRWLVENGRENLSAVPPPARAFKLRWHLGVLWASSVHGQQKHGGRRRAHAEGRSSERGAPPSSSCQWLCGAQVRLLFAQGLRWYQNANILLPLRKKNSG